MPPIAETAHLRRYYLDTNSWDRLLDHPDCEDLVRCLTRPGKRAVFVSFINAFEILRIPEEKREQQLKLAALISRTVQPDHVVLGLPGDLIFKAVRQFKAGERQVLLGDSADTERLRKLLSSPTDMEPEEFARMEAWIAKVTGAVTEYWMDVPEEAFNAETRVSEEFLNHPKMVELLLSMDLFRDLGLVAEDLPRLRSSLAVWSAMVASIALLVAQSMRARFSKGKARKLPGARDILQLTYLGFVHYFVTDDDGLFQAARNEVAPFVPGGPKVMRPSELFAQLGYPLLTSSPSRPS